MDTSITIGGLSLSTLDDGGVSRVVSKLDGWGAPAGTLSPTQRPRQSGAWGGDSFLKARPVAVAGWVMGSDPSSVLANADLLKAAVSLDDTVLEVTEAGRLRWCTVRRDGDVIITWHSPVAFEFSFQVVALDPRLFGSELSGSTGLPSSTGGLTVPFAVPFSINAVTVSGQVNLTNTGNIDGPVRLRIDGPCTGPIVTHVASGASLVFSSSLTLAAGEWLDVDMEARTVLANGQASRSAWVTSRGWSEFEVGDNTFAFTAASYSPGAKLTVYAMPSFQ